MSGKTEISFGEQMTDQHTFKINNFRKCMMLGEEVRSSFIEMFPPASRKKIAFVVKPLPNGSAIMEYYRYPLLHGGSARITTTDIDKFFWLQLIHQDYDSLRLAGTVEIKLGESKQIVNFGDPQNENYEKFSYGSLEIKPRNRLDIRFKSGQYKIRCENLIHVKLSGAEEVDLELKFSLFCPGKVSNVQVKEKALPDSLKTSVNLKELTKAIMEDKSTSDLMITCGDKMKKKTFHVHKSFFCARSPVFRAAVETDMLEKKTSEIYIEVF